MCQEASPYSEARVGKPRANVVHEGVSLLEYALPLVIEPFDSLDAVFLSDRAHHGLLNNLKAVFVI